jgi:hypothetical protein
VVRRDQVAALGLRDRVTKGLPEVWEEEAGPFLLKCREREALSLCPNRTERLTL